MNRHLSSPCKACKFCQPNCKRLGLTVISLILASSADLAVESNHAGEQKHNAETQEAGDLPQVPGIQPL